MVRFVKLDTNEGPGIRIEFSDTPTYQIRQCDFSLSITLPGASRYRIWTFKKEDGKLQLSCNGVQINDFNFMESDNAECKEMWSYDFAHVKIVGHDKDDTATDYIRQYKDGQS